MEDTQRSTYYKYCIVPMCLNTSFKTPNKIFIRVPVDKKRRINWLYACRRNVKDISEKNTAIHVCEDHFNLENDMANYLRWKLMGGQKKIKSNVVPHKFECQEKIKLLSSQDISCIVAGKERFHKIEHLLSSPSTSSKMQTGENVSVDLHLPEEFVFELHLQPKKKDVGVTARPYFRSKQTQTVHQGV